MKPRNHPQRRSTRRYRHAVAAVVALALGVLAAPAALAEPYEYLNQHDEGAAASGTGSAHTKWPQRQLEYLEGQEAAFAADDNGSYQAQQDAYLRYLEQKAAAANGAEPAVETSADDSGQPWLIGVGLAAAAIVASLVLAIVRSRRQESITPAHREREKLNL